MSTRKLLLSNFGGMAEVAYFDHENPHAFRTKTFQDCAPIVEAAKILAEEKPGKDMRLVAKIPLSVLDQSFREGWFGDKERWRKWANDGANRAFRVWPGRI